MREVTMSMFDRSWPFYPMPGFEERMVRVGEDVEWREGIGHVNEQFRARVAERIGNGPFMVVSMSAKNAEIRNESNVCCMVPYQWLEPCCDGA